MEHSATGKINLLAALAPTSVREIHETRRMTRLKCQASDTLEGLLRPLVLVVDDDAEYREVLLEYLLETDLCRVATAPSAAKALEVLERLPVRLVVTDQHMPVMGGVELLRVVTQRWPQVGRVLMSSSNSSSVGTEVGQFVLKGVDLVATTETLLGLIQR